MAKNVPINGTAIAARRVLPQKGSGAFIVLFMKFPSV
jgi:hypothetical protein